MTNATIGLGVELLLEELAHDELAECCDLLPCISTFRDRDETGNLQTCLRASCSKCGRHAEGSGDTIAAAWDVLETQW